MRIIDLRGQNLSRAELLAAMPRAAMGTSEATDLVRPILDDVKERGAAALRDFEEKFDHVRPKNLRVPGRGRQGRPDHARPRKCAPPSRNRCAAPAPWPPTRCRRTSTPTSPKAPAWPNADSDSARRPVCARRQGRLPELRHHERCAGPGRRRRIAGHRHPARPRQ